MRAGRQPQSGHGLFKQVSALTVQSTILLQVPRFQLRIGEEGIPAIPFGLTHPRRHHPVPDRGRGIGLRQIIAERADRHGRHLDLKIEPIQEGAG